ncbi:MAG: hypothetical protein JWO33_1768 [Caulobacteraceae bacterium]|nr:hypothetical protein [Caulobacteraceae bacterium]
MTRIATLLRIGVAAACALSLGGCISLLPKTKPVTLYRFGQTPAAESAATPARTVQVGVLRAGGLFQRESAGDRLLTVTGDKVAFIAQARWAAPAQIMFEQAVLAAFDADAGPARLIARGEPVTAKLILRIDVRNFEVRYDRGDKAAPDVVVRVRATIIPRGDGTGGVEQVFETHVRAADNRVGAIVSAFDRATDEVLGKLVAWTDAQAVAIP